MMWSVLHTLRITG